MTCACALDTVHLPLTSPHERRRRHRTESRAAGTPRSEQGHGPGNIVNPLRLLQRERLRGLDMSRLTIRQAYLAEVDAQDASLVDAQLAVTVLAGVPQPARLGRARRRRHVARRGNVDRPDMSVPCGGPHPGVCAGWPHRRDLGRGPVQRRPAHGQRWRGRRSAVVGDQH